MIRYAAVALALLLAACGGDGDPAGTPATTPPAATTSAPAATTTSAAPATPPADHTIRVVVRGGKVEGGSGSRVKVDRGKRVRIEVVADVSDEVHVHAYDLKAPVTPDRPAVLDFVADIPGVIEVELEGAHLLLFKLEIR